MSSATYPVRVEASLDSPLSRWLWLVKWILAIPHYIVLAFLWLAFAVLSVVAFVVILFTGRYPRSIFDFNTGVLRWTWRVQYYAYGALATDHYPPFTLAEAPDYPAHLEISYPERLSRGLVLVKWWLLAIPHYLVLGFFIGGGAWVAWQFDNTRLSWAGGGLIGLLVLIAAVVLAVTGRYPQPVYDFVLGMNRWVLRVAAYAGLMTDDYPPFRLDMGGHEPGGMLTMPPSSPTPAEPNPTSPTPVPPTSTQPVTPPVPPTGAPRTGWTAGRIVAVVAGSVLALISLGLFGAGTAGLVADQAGRDDGYVSFGTDSFRTDGYAVASDRIELRGVSWTSVSSFVGDVRVRVTSTDPAKAMFVGIAPADDVDQYLADVHYAVVRDLANGAHYTIHAGGSPATTPGETGIWTAKVSGVGTQSLIWSVEDGDWSVVAMNADASPGVHVRVQTAATLPALMELSIASLVTGLVLLTGAIVLIVIPVRRASGSRVPPSAVD